MTKPSLGTHLALPGQSPILKVLAGVPAINARLRNICSDRRGHSNYLPRTATRFPWRMLAADPRKALLAEVRQPPARIAQRSKMSKGSHLAIMLNQPHCGLTNDLHADPARVATTAPAKIATPTCQLRQKDYGGAQDERTPAAHKSLYKNSRTGRCRKNRVSHRSLLNRLLGGCAIKHRPRFFTHAQKRKSSNSQKHCGINNQKAGKKMPPEKI